MNNGLSHACLTATALPGVRQAGGHAAADGREAVPFDCRHRAAAAGPEPGAQGDAAGSSPDKMITPRCVWGGSALAVPQERVLAYLEILNQRPAVCLPSQK